MGSASGNRTRLAAIVVLRGLKWLASSGDSIEMGRHVVDEQLRGPYRQWIHEHTFEPRNGGTLACDLVRYAVPFDFLIHEFFVRRDIEKIFGFRNQELSKRFALIS